MPASNGSRFVICRRSQRVRNSRASAWISFCTEPSREPSKVPYYMVLVLLALFAIGPLVVLAFNLLGDGLRDALDPRLKT